MDGQTRERSAGKLTIGLDLGERKSHFCVLAGDGAVLEEGTVVTNPSSFEKHFRNYSPSLIALEVCPHSRWASQVLERCGHEVLVANPIKIKLITQATQKNDRVDARTLARTGAIQPDHGQARSRPKHGVKASFTNSGCDLHCRWMSMPQRFVHLSGNPQMVQEHGELPGHGNDRSLSSAATSALGNGEPPAPQVAVLAKRTENIVRRLHHQSPQVAIPVLANSHLWIAGPGLMLLRSQSENNTRPAGCARNGSDLQASSRRPAL